MKKLILVINDPLDSTQHSKKTEISAIKNPDSSRAGSVSVPPNRPKHA